MGRVSIDLREQRASDEETLQYDFVQAVTALVAGVDVLHRGADELSDDARRRITADLATRADALRRLMPAVRSRLG